MSAFAKSGWRKCVGVRPNAANRRCIVEHANLAPERDGLRLAVAGVDAHRLDRVLAAWVKSLGASHAIEYDWCVQSMPRWYCV